MISSYTARQNSGQRTFSADHRPPNTLARLCIGFIQSYFLCKLAYSPWEGEQLGSTRKEEDFFAYGVDNIDIGGSDCSTKADGECVAKGPGDETLSPALLPGVPELSITGERTSSRGSCIQGFLVLPSGPVMLRSSTGATMPKLF